MSFFQTRFQINFLWETSDISSKFNQWWFSLWKTRHVKISYIRKLLMRFFFQKKKITHKTIHFSFKKILNYILIILLDKLNFIFYHSWKRRLWIKGNCLHIYKKNSHFFFLTQIFRHSFLFFFFWSRTQVKFKNTMKVFYAKNCINLQILNWEYKIKKEIFQLHVWPPTEFFHNPLEGIMTLTLRRLML